MFDEEYYCPNCNAVLNNQPGFDPDLGAWTCTECGETLYGDDVMNTMDQFDGVVWICDSCGAILNKQCGFYDSCGSWYCEKCGHENRISEDEIYDSEEAYQNRNKHICPVCGSILDDQYSFYEYENTHTCIYCGTELFKKNDEYERLCTCPKCDEILNKQYSYYVDAFEYECRECGAELRKNGDEYGIVYRCSNCDDVLNEQYGFYDSDDEYKCSECGTVLHRSDDEYTILYKCSECDETLNLPLHTYEPSKYSLYDYPTFEEYDLRNTKQPAVQKKSEVILDIITKVLSNRKEYTVGKSSYELRGKHVDQVYNYLNGKGFSNFRLVPHKDICKGSYYPQGEVYCIAIGNKTDFARTDAFPFNAEIHIRYHEKETLTFPYSNKQVVGRDYKEIAESLSGLGFSEVCLYPMRDLILGLRKNDGIIDCVVVNGRKKYKKGVTYDYDVKIEIYYHSYIIPRKQKIL